MAEKTMFIANFNITFGEKEDPMLMHFEDIIYPAFHSGLIVKGAKKGEGFTTFCIQAVELKEIGNQLVLVGNYIKNTTLEVLTTFDEELKDDYQSIPTSPYSRFVIFLKNHRMVLVKNESLSPNIKSFQTAVRKLLNAYITRLNKEQKEKLPRPVVNIVEMKLRDDVKTACRDLSKIESVEFKFFPLNNDNDYSQLASNANMLRKVTGSKDPRLLLKSPASKEGVISAVSDIQEHGLALTIIRGRDVDGQPIRIEEDNFTTNRKIKYDGNLRGKDDHYIIGEAQKNENIITCSEDNKKMYEDMIDKISKMI